MSLPVPPAPPAQIQNVAGSMDNINQQIYTSMARDPILGPIVKAIPPPPKVSALLSGTFLQQLQNGMRQVAPNVPFIPGPTQQPQRPPAGYESIVV